MFLVAGFMGSAIIGAFLALLPNYMDRSFASEEQMEEAIRRAIPPGSSRR